jgi:hypothetical protein
MVVRLYFKRQLLACRHRSGLRLTTGLPARPRATLQWGGLVVE